MCINLIDCVPGIVPAEGFTTAGHQGLYVAYCTGYVSVVFIEEGGLTETITDTLSSYMWGDADMVWKLKKIFDVKHI